MGKLVLVVDDEDMTRQMIAMFLKMDGHDAVEAENGVDALEKVSMHQPDAIILDVMMPVMDGITVCKKLRANPATASIPVLMLSGRSQLGAEEEGLEAGANAYMKKPMDPKEMLTLLKEMMMQPAVVKA
ncbi:MAG: response regulator [Anaerolineae bacterium]|nr:response regulator [Anaerolineae bacterium]